MRILTYLCLGTVSILSVPTPSIAQQKASTKQTASSFSGNGRTINYLIYEPASTDQSENTAGPIPLLLFLHGGGEGGDDLEKVKTHGPPKLIAEGKQFPFFVLSPQNPSKTQFWDDQLLIQLLDHITDHHPIDLTRVYLSGMSRGGFAAWRLAIQNPNRFAALVPIAGGGPVPYVGRIKHIPTWVFHGKRDQVIPFHESERLVRALRAAGGNVRFTEYPDAKHDSWTETFENPELYQWIKEQQRIP